MNNLIIVTLIVLVALVFVFFIVRSRSADPEKKRVPNYRALFILGVTWLPIGIATENPGLWGAGIVFMIIGAANKSKWGQETKWRDLPPETKRAKLIFVAGMTVVLLVLVLVYFFSNGK